MIKRHFRGHLTVRKSMCNYHTEYVPHITTCIRLVGSYLVNSLFTSSLPPTVAAKMQVHDILSSIAQVTALLVGLAATAAGVRGILKPDDFATSFGLPSTKSSAWMTQHGAESKFAAATDSAISAPETDADSNAFIPVVGVRNIALGLSLLVFTIMRDPRTTGILLLCNQVTMVGDTIICRRKGAPGSATPHLVAGVVFALLGGYMVAAM